jgi:protein-disulfide isomerase
MQLLCNLVILSFFLLSTGAGWITPAVLSQEFNCGCEDKPQLEVLAVVNGVKITRQDLSPDTKMKVMNLQQEVIEARENEINVLINSTLLSNEATKRNISVQKLIQIEVVDKIAAPTDAEALAFYNKHKDEIGDEFKDVKADVMTWLRDERERAAVLALANSLRASAEVKVLLAAITPPANEAEKARVLATVNGAQITSGAVEENLLPLIFNVQQQVFNTRRSELDLKINDLLLANEAKKQGQTIGELRASMKARVPIPTEAQAQTFYNQNKAKIRRDFADVKDQIIQYLFAEEEKKSDAAFVAQLRSSASLQIFLTPPDSPIFKIALDDQPSKGNPKAAVTLVQFTDFQCPSCAQHHPILERLLNEYGDNVRLVVRDFPLSQHANAMKAAEAAEAAREQGKYWEYTDLLYRNQSALQIDKLKQYASSLGLDRVKFDAALDSGKYSDRVQRDVAEGDRLGVDSTPTFFVNGRLVSDSSYAGLKSRIEAELKVQQAKQLTSAVSGRATLLALAPSKGKSRR